MSNLRAVPAPDALVSALDVRQQLPGRAVQEIQALPVEAIGALHQAAARLLSRTAGTDAGRYAEMIAETAEAAHVELLRLQALLEAWQ